MLCCCCSFFRVSSVYLQVQKYFNHFDIRFYHTKKRTINLLKTRQVYSKNKEKFWFDSTRMDQKVYEYDIHH